MVYEARPFAIKQRDAVDESCDDIVFGYVHAEDGYTVDAMRKHLADVMPAVLREAGNPQETVQELQQRFGGMSRADCVAAFGLWIVTAYYDAERVRPGTGNKALQRFRLHAYHGEFDRFIARLIEWFPRYFLTCPTMAGSCPRFASVLHFAGAMHEWYPRIPADLQ